MSIGLAANLSLGGAVEIRIVRRSCLLLAQKVCKHEFLENTSGEAAERARGVVEEVMNVHTDRNLL